jgi:hypothetical protein
LNAGFEAVINAVGYVVEIASVLLEMRGFSLVAGSL